jgi:type VI secretion system protein ImpC
MSGELQHRLSRTRGSGRSRVTLLYELSGSRGPVNRELPFGIGVLADLSGHKANRPAMRDRRWITLDRDDFAERMERLEPTVTLNVPGLGEFTLRFHELDDFGPAQVAAQVPALTELIHARRRLGQFAGSQDDLDQLLADLTGRSAILRSVTYELRPTQSPKPASAPPPPASGAALLDQILGQMPAVELSPSGGGDTIDQLIRHAAMTGTTVSRDVETTIAAWRTALDRRLGDGVRAVLHHSDFRAMEGTWRGLWHLVRNAETSETLKLRVFDVNRSELERDLVSPTSAIFEKTAVQPYREGGEPVGLLVGGYEFGPGDVALLQQLARVGQAAHAPFVATASAGLLGLDRFAGLPDAEELNSRAKGEALAAWQSFRSSAEARYAVLIVPRVMARRPYGKEHTAVEEFSFEELAGGTPADRCCWMSAAWCYAVVIADAFASDGWFTRSAGLEGGGKVAGLPAFPIEADDEAVFVGPTEVAIPGREADALSRLGFTPLIAVRGSDAAAFMTAHSCRKTAGEDDMTLGEVRHLLGVSRFAQYLLTIGHLHPSATAEELGAILNDWLSRYTASDPDNWDPARQPLLKGMVKVKPVPGQPGVNRVVAALVLPVSESSAPTLAINIGTIPV